MRIFSEDFFCIRNKTLFFNLIRRNLKLKYRQSYLGILWTLLVPAFNAVIYYFVFQFVLRVGIPNYFLFVLSGIMAWQFFAGSVLNSIESITGNASLVNKVPVPPRVFPYAEATTVFINFLLSLPILLIVGTLTKDKLSILNLKIFYYIGLLYLQTYGYCLIFSTLFVFLRDLRHFLAIVIQAWFYLTPIVYTPDMVPSQYFFVQYVNPLAFVFHGIHENFVFNRNLPPTQDLVAAAWSVVVLLLGFVVYIKSKKVLVENV